MPKTLLVEMSASIAQFRETVSGNMQRWTRARTPQAFSAVEQQAHALARKVADDIVAAVLRDILNDVVFQVSRTLDGAIPWSNREVPFLPELSNAA